MGQIIFHCTDCGAKLSAELNEAGEEFECPECQHLQKVPGGPTAASTQTSPGTPVHTGTGGPVIRIPKRKIVMSSQTSRVDEEEDEEEEYEEEIGGSGVALFAVALGTAGLILCCLSVVWMFISQRDGSNDWWMSLIVFLATFLMGLMGLVLAQLSRLVVRLADRVSRLGDEEEE